MMLRRSLVAEAFIFFAHVSSVRSSAIDEDHIGGWYMAFLSKDFTQSRFGAQGDIQYRTWDGGGDLEQLLIRGGLTYRPDALPGKYTLGVANITSGQFGQSNRTKTENRTYQEALIPQRVGEKWFLKHRLRFEQRWVNGQDFRTRFRYALFANVPLNRPDLSPGALYLALYKELSTGSGMLATEERSIYTIAIDFMRRSAISSVRPVRFKRVICSSTATR